MRPLGRSKRRHEDDNKIGLREIDYEVHVFQDELQRPSFMLTFTDTISRKEPCVTLHSTGVLSVESRRLFRTRRRLNCGNCSDIRVVR
jgi:hypothetical protein